MDIQRYLDLITSQHRDKPKFITWLSSALLKIDDAVSTAQKISPSFDPDLAVGVQLDTLGKIVGRERVLNFQPSDGSPPKLDDDTFRLVIKAKTLQNQWDGTVPQVQEMWKSLLPDLDLQIQDHQDMTMTVMVLGALSPLEQNLIQNGYIVPKPAGVTTAYEFAVITDLNAYFGFVVQDGTFETIQQII